MRHTFLLLLVPIAACSNYDFAKARTADGGLDVPKLIAALQASGEKQLHQGLWIPLLWLDLTTFEASDANYPAGFTLQEIHGIGPILCAGQRTASYVDQQGAQIERDDRRWLGWGVLYHDQDQSLPTPFGERHADQGRILLLWGWDDAGYERPTTAPASRPARQ